jgi:hypothetical protein
VRGCTVWCRVMCQQAQWPAGAHLCWILAGLVHDAGTQLIAQTCSNTKKEQQQPCAQHSRTQQPAGAAAVLWLQHRPFLRGCCRKSLRRLAMQTVSVAPKAGKGGYNNPGPTLQHCSLNTAWPYTHLLQAGGLVGLLLWPASNQLHTQLA